MTSTTSSPLRRDRRVLRCSGTADFLAALPRLVGFTARDSVFVVLFEGARAESALRFDLPCEGGPRSTAALIDLLCDALARAGELGASPGIVIDCEQRFRETAGPPWQGFANRLRERLAQLGIRPRELCCVAPDGWGSYADPDLPAAGRPLQEIAQSRISLEADLGEAVIPELSSIGTIRAASAEHVAATELALGEGERPGSIQDRLAASAEAAEAVLRAGGDAPDPVLSARLARSASEAGHWLVLALTLLTGSEFVVRLAGTSDFRRFVGLPAECEGGDRSNAHPPHDATDHPSALLSRTPPFGGEGAGGSSAPPEPAVGGLLAAVAHDDTDRVRLRRAAEALESAIGPVPDRLRPGLFALAAWARWMTGMGSVAGRHVDAALRLDPEHGLAHMMAGLIADGPVGAPHVLASQVLAPQER